MQPQPQFVDLYRANLRSAADLMKTSLQQTERLHQQQLEIVRRALEESERSTNQIAEARSIDDIIAVNTRVAGAQLERITAFWSSMWHAAAESQKLMVDQMQAQLAQASSRMRQGYDFTARTSEEAARLAGKQMADTTDQLRVAGVEQERHAQGQRQAQERKATEGRKTV
jgi:hypothetical protein